MLQSKLFTKTLRQPIKDEPSRNAQLLERAGFVYKNFAGVYSFLPLGLQVLNKIIDIVREEMNAIGGQEVMLGALQDAKVWRKSGRWSDGAADAWFKTKLKNDTELGLGWTHEEPLAELMARHISSYKDLPVYVYQFQTKFRNELRAKSGLMRVREFIMKDLYSFTRTQAELDKFYEKVAAAYVKIFDRVGVGGITFRTYASGQPFSKFSDEFQTISEAGEDTIYLDRKKKIAVNKEVYSPEVIRELKLKQQDLEEIKAIEVGNIFKLGTKYAQAVGLNFTDKDGTKQPVVMGSYGIGPGRVMGAVVETHNDNSGIIWPESIAPFKIHLLALDKKADRVYQDLQKAEIEVLYDEREVSAGEKFADADLIGIPWRAVVSKKTGEKVELKRRDSEQTELLGVKELAAKLKSQKTKEQKNTKT